MAYLYQDKGKSIWMLGYKDAQGRLRRVSTGTDQKDLAEIIKGRTLERVERQRLGIDEHLDTRGELVEELVKEYGKYVYQVKQRSKAHVKDIGSALGKIIDLTGVATLGQFNHDAITHALYQYRLGDESTDEQGKSHRTPRKARTVNKARSYLFTFFRWLIKSGRWKENPIERIEPLEETDKREFRALTFEELDRLLRAVPEYRRVVYLVAAHTGLRYNELRTLTWGDLDLEAGSVTVRKKNAKNRKEEPLPLTRDACTVLSEWREKRPGLPAAKVFKKVPRPATLDNDLVRAGIEKETADGVMSFHGLRRTFGTNLDRSDVPLARAQKLLRHSSPVLTSNYYTLSTFEDKREGIDRLQAKLDELSTKEGEEERKQA